MIRLRLAELDRRKTLVSVGAITAVLAIVAVVVVTRSDGSDALRGELEAEFHGAYPATPAGGGDMVEIDLVAGPATTPLVDGVDTENLQLASRNHPALKTVDALAVTVYDVVDCPSVVVSEQAPVSYTHLRAHETRR